MADGLAAYTGVRRRFELKGVGRRDHRVRRLRTSPDRGGGADRRRPRRSRHRRPAAECGPRPAGGRFPTAPVLPDRRRSPTRSASPSARADLVVVLDVYGAREDPQPGVTGELIAVGRPGRRRGGAVPPRSGRRPPSFVAGVLRTGRHRDHHGRRRRHRDRPGVVDPVGGDMSTATTPGTRRSEPDTESAARRATSLGAAAGRAVAAGGGRVGARRRSTRQSPAEPGKRRRWPWLLAIALVLVLLAGAVYAVFFSPLLGVKSVTITGAPDERHRQGPGRRRRAGRDTAGPRRSRCDRRRASSPCPRSPRSRSPAAGRTRWRSTVTPRVPVAVTSANGQFWLLDAHGRSVPVGVGAARRD